MELQDGFSSQANTLLDELHAHLAYYVQREAIDFWDNTRILPGAKWQEEMNTELQLARVAILLVSADFLASDSITQHELPSLLSSAKQKGTKILCVILRPCAFEDSDLAQFLPVNTQPLSGLSKVKRDEIWNRVARMVRDGWQSY